MLNNNEIELIVLGAAGIFSLYIAYLLFCFSKNKEYDLILELRLWNAFNADSKSLIKIFIIIGVSALSFGLLSASIGDSDMYAKVIIWAGIFIIIAGSILACYEAHLKLSGSHCTTQKCSSSLTISENDFKEKDREKYKELLRLREIIEFAITYSSELKQSEKDVAEKIEKLLDNGEDDKPFKELLSNASSYRVNQPSSRSELPSALFFLWIFFPQNTPV